MKKRYHIQVRQADGWVYLLQRTNTINPRDTTPREYTRKEADDALVVLTKYGRKKATYTIIPKE